MARKPSVEEQALFRAALADVEPLRRRRAPTPKKVRVEPEPAAKAPAPAKPAAAPKSSPKPTMGPARNHAPLRKLDKTTVAGLDQRSAERLRRGQLEIEGRIDLHGMTQDQAYGALNGYVDRAWRSGSRCILVITGKGGGARAGGEEGPGVLRRNVPHWLALAPNRDKVLAIATAQPQHGGAGALYILLKRQREARS